MERPKPLTEKEIRARMETLPEWEFTGAALRRKFAAPTFVEGIEFVRRVADAAERLDHHPDIDIRWRFVTFTVSTHDPKGVTDLDFRLASDIDALAPTDAP